MLHFPHLRHLCVLDELLQHLWMSQPLWNCLQPAHHCLPDPSHSIYFQWVYIDDASIPFQLLCVLEDVGLCCLQHPTLVLNLALYLLEATLQVLLILLYSCYFLTQPT